MCWSQVQACWSGGRWWLFRRLSFAPASGQCQNWGWCHSKDFCFHPNPKWIRGLGWWHFDAFHTHTKCIHIHSTSTHLLETYISCLTWPFSLSDWMIQLPQHANCYRGQFVGSHVHHASTNDTTNEGAGADGIWHGPHKSFEHVGRGLHIPLCGKSPSHLAIMGWVLHFWIKPFFRDENDFQASSH